MKKMPVCGLLVLPAILLSACSMLTPPAEDPVLIKLEELDQRLQAIERVMENQSLVQLTQQVDALERRAISCRAVGNAAARCGTTADRQRQLYADLDSRIQELEASARARTASVLDGGTLPPGQLPVPGGSDRDNYQVALGAAAARSATTSRRHRFSSFWSRFPTASWRTTRNTGWPSPIMRQTNSRRRWRTSHGSSRTTRNHARCRMRC